jgi:hypothetical protein
MALAAEHNCSAQVSAAKPVESRGMLLSRVGQIYAPDTAKFYDLRSGECEHVIILEDLQKDVAGVYKHRCEFFGVDHRFLPDFPIINPRQRARSALIRNLLYNPPRSFSLASQSLGASAE